MVATYENHSIDMEIIQLISFGFYMRVILINNRLVLQPRYQNDVIRRHCAVFNVNEDIQYTIQQVNTLA